MLIAFISDLFGKMKLIGVANWKFMQAKSITEMGSSISTSYYYNALETTNARPRIIHFIRRTRDIEQEEIENEEEKENDLSI